MTKTKTVIEFLIVALMVGISVLVLPQIGSAQAARANKTPNQTGCKAKVEDEDANDTDKKEKKSKYAKEAKISMAEARAAALKRVPGTILEEDLENENGRLQYAFDVCSENKQIFDVEIDAKTGEVLKAALDDEDDNEDDNQQSKTMRKENNFML